MRGVDSEPGKAEAEHSGPPAVTGETDTAPARASEGERLADQERRRCGRVEHFASQSHVPGGDCTELRGHDPSTALPRVRAAVGALTGIERSDVIADMATAQLVAARTLATDRYRCTAGDGELEV